MRIDLVFNTMGEIMFELLRAVNFKLTWLKAFWALFSMAFSQARGDREWTLFQ